MSSRLMHYGSNIVFCTGQPSRRLSRTLDVNKVACSKCRKHAEQIATDHKEAMDRVKTELTKPVNKHGQTCEETCGAMAARGFHSALCHSVES